MQEEKNWQLTLADYLRQGEPSQAEKSALWQTAIGLQAVDGLKPSEYLLETAREHIVGSIDLPAAKQRIQSYYQQRENRQAVEDGTMEADLVSVRIAEILGEKTFQFSPVTLQTIHRRLFTGVFDHAGTIRPYNLTKREWVLNGDTVTYAAYQDIPAALAYDFAQEKQFSYAAVSVPEAVQHIAGFASGLWQIHPFCEGNTRATAVFVILYLKTFGFQVNNDVFAAHSWYFRNALVRANYNNLQKGVHATTEFLEQFFENLLLNARHEMKNRHLHIEADSIAPGQSVTQEAPKCQNDTLKCTFEELAILKALAEDPRLTQSALAKQTGKSPSTIKRRMKEMQEKQLLRRVNGKRNGKWELLVDLSGRETP